MSWHMPRRTVYYLYGLRGMFSLIHGIHDVFHIQRLKAATLDEFKGRKRRKMPAIREDVYEVEELLKNRVVRGKEQYLVKWKGFSLGHSSWEPVSNLRCPRLLQQYREEQD